MKKKQKERKEARRLRNAGKSLREISKILRISKSSASLWTRDIELRPEQRDSLWLRLGDHPRMANAARSSKAREVRKDAQRAGANLVKKADPRFWAGCALYWAEGTKARNHVLFANSDPDMVRFFVSFLRKYFKTSDEAFTLRVVIYEGNGVTLKKAKEYWQSVTDLPKTCWRKCRVVENKPRKGKSILEYGTFYLQINDTFLVQRIFGAIQEMFGFEREVWLG